MSIDAARDPLAGSAPDLDMIVSDLASLRRDFATLMKHVKTGAIKGANGVARDAAGQLGDAADRVSGNLAAFGDRSVKAVGRQIGEQPIISLVLAFALGFAGSRWLSR